MFTGIIIIGEHNVKMFFMIFDFFLPENKSLTFVSTALILKKPVARKSGFAKSELCQLFISLFSETLLPLPARQTRSAATHGLDILVVSIYPASNFLHNGVIF